MSEKNKSLAQVIFETAAKADTRPTIHMNPPKWDEAIPGIQSQFEEMANAAREFIKNEGIK
jgi:hypothetical protein